MNLNKFPTEPGCYLFKDTNNNIIYVGKAKNLKKRVSSYFTKKDHDKKTQQLVLSIRDVEFIATDSEVEALLLENNLIKKFSPKYNIVLKDSKRYAYLRLTEEKYPRLMIARTFKEKGTYFGPFVSAETRDHIREILTKTFKLRTCNRLHKRACLRHHINLCSAPCVNEIDEKTYLEAVKSTELVLKGKINELIIFLVKKMGEYSQLNKFEQALETRKKIEALEWLKDKQKVEREKKYNEDIINYIVKKDQVHLILFNVKKGILENKQTYLFDFETNFLEKFLIQYYSDNKIPKEIIIPKKISEECHQALEKQSGQKITIIVPKIGEKKDLLNLVIKNIELQFFSEETNLEDLKDKLKLNEIPKIIECFDISHLSGTHTVASMVQFRNGLADKKNYRRFKIRSVAGIDDFASIAEVVSRRYKRLKSENLEMPNLIVIDGGKGQLKFALKSLQELDIKIPIISLAKRLEEVYVPGMSIPLNINQKTKAIMLLRRIRDEAHRFAITYNRLLRKKELKK